MNPWIKIDSTDNSTWPPDGILVDTKIDDEKGERNHQSLCRVRNMWFSDESMTMYVYYAPTHWRMLKCESD